MDGEKIRVLRIINRFNLGGPTFNVAYLTRYMDDRFETRLVGGSKDESEASSTFILDELGIEPTIIGQMQRSISPINDRKAYHELRQIIREFRPHIVHTHASKSGTLGRLAAIHEDVPIILHTFHGHVFHSYFGGFKTWIYKSIERYLAKRSTRIIAISNIQKRELGEEHGIAPPHKIEVVPLGFDLSRFTERQEEKRTKFRSKYGLSDQHVAIGIVGRLVPIKNHPMFLSAVAALVKDHPNARFFIVGDGEEKDALLEGCRNLGIEHTWQAPPTEDRPLCFTSWIREIDVVMAGLDVVALTSKNEGTPVSLIEAQAAGKPVVSTRVGGIEDIVEDGASALLVGQDVQAFTTQLQRLLEDASLRASMGARGRDRILKSHSYTRLVQDMEELYLRLMHEKFNES